MPSARVLAALLAVSVALAAAGCGSSKKKASAKTQPVATAPATTQTETTAPTTTSAPKSSGGVVPVANAKDLKHKPRLATPHGSPPASLIKKDLVVGHGPAAHAGDTATVQYVGISWSNGKQFDASWDRGQPFTFPLGQSQVIQGWDQGVVGMKAGGRRELVIPPDLGYGPAGAPPSIGPNETLVFVIDLKRIG
jgi:peptidylprolyl isomerase